MRNGWTDLHHAAQRIRDERIEAIKVGVLTQDLDKAKVTVRRAPSYWETTVRALDTLRSKGTPVALTVEQHASCPGHAAYIDTTDEPVVVYVCEDYKAHGHLKIAAPKDPNAPARTPMTEEERATRRELIANNKSWRSAQTVRREWLATFAGRKGAPKGATGFIGQVVASSGALARASEQGHPLAATLLGHTQGGRREYLTALLRKATVARQNHIVLVIAMAAIEQSTSEQTWQYPGGITAEYFRALESWAYPLSEVEQIAKGEQRS